MSGTRSLSSGDEAGRLRRLAHLQAWTGVGLGAALCGTWVPAVSSNGWFTLAALAVFVSLGVAWSVAYRRLVGASLAVARKIESRESCSRQDSETVACYDEAIASFGPLVPVWRDTIEGGRLRMETAVADLARRFDSLHEALDIALDDSDASGISARQEAIHEVTESAREAFITLWESLEASARRDEEALAIIGSLSRQNESLVSLTTEIRQIAKRINLLSLNAAIEATRAGDAGHGFAVVAGEVRALAAQSADTGDRIESVVDGISGEIEAVMQQAQANLTSSREARQANRAVIDQTIDGINQRFDSLAEEAKELMDLRDDTSHEIAGVIVQLQFQDELSQVLGHVEAALDEAHRLLGSVRSGDGRSFVEGARVLAENLKRRASTDLERGVIAGKPPSQLSPIHDDNQVEFF